MMGKEGGRRASQEKEEHTWLCVNRERPSGGDMQCNGACGRDRRTAGSTEVILHPPKNTGECETSTVG